MGGDDPPMGLRRPPGGFQGWAVAAFRPGHGRVGIEGLAGGALPARSAKPAVQYMTTLCDVSLPQVPLRFLPAEAGGENGIGKQHWRCRWDAGR